MKVTLGQLRNSLNALSALSSKEVPAKVAYRLKRLIASINGEMKHFNEAHLELLKKHGAKDIDGSLTLTPDDAGFAAFMPEFTELVSEEVEVWGDPFQLDALGDVTLSTDTLFILDWLIKDGDDEPAKEEAKLKEVGA